MFATTLATLLLTAVLTAEVPFPTPNRSSHRQAAQQQQDKVDKKQLKRELKDRATALDTKDAQGLYALALWATRNGLKLDARRLLNKVVKADPDHANARDSLGYTKYDGKWVKKSRVEALARKKLEADYKRRGFVKHDGEWVKKSELVYFKRGYVRHEGQWIRRDDHKQYLADMVPHPATGEWISKADIENAEKNLFPVEGKWLSAADANAVHASWDNPWMIQGKDVVVVTNYPFEKAEQIMLEAETTVSKIRGFIYDPILPLPRRITIYAFGNQGDYRQFGAENDITGFSSYGAFFAAGHPDRPTAVFHGHKEWGDYYLKHGVGLAVSNQLLGSDKVRSTAWIHTAIGCYLERFATPRNAKWFATKFLNRGGIKDLDKYWDRFEISADISTDAVERNIYTAGFVMLYAAKGRDAKLQKAWDAVREAIQGKPKKLAKALQSFQKAASSAEQEIRNYLDKMSQG